MIFIWTEQEYTAPPYITSRFASITPRLLFLPSTIIAAPSRNSSIAPAGNSSPWRLKMVVFSLTTTATGRVSPVLAFVVLPAIIQVDCLSGKGALPTTVTLRPFSSSAWTSVGSSFFTSSACLVSCSCFGCASSVVVRSCKAVCETPSSL